MNTKHQPRRLVALMVGLCLCFFASIAIADGLPGYEQYRRNFFLTYESEQVLCVVDEVCEAHTMRLADGSKATVLLLRVATAADEGFRPPVLLVDIAGKKHYRQIGDWIMEGKLFFADFDADGADDILAVTDYGACGGFGGYAWSILKLSPEGIALLYDNGAFYNNVDFSPFRAIPKPGWQFEIHHETLPFSMTFQLPADHDAMYFYDDQGMPNPDFALGFWEDEYRIMGVDSCYMVYPVPQAAGPALLGVAQYCWTGSHNGSYVGSAHTLLRFNAQKERFEEVEVAFTPCGAKDYRPPWAQFLTDWFMDLSE